MVQDIEEEAEALLIGKHASESEINVRSSSEMEVPENFQDEKLIKKIKEDQMIKKMKEKIETPKEKGTTGSGDNIINIKEFKEKGIQENQGKYCKKLPRFY